MPRPKAQRNQIKYKYSKHEIVWAKIAGFPWWPASITCTPSKSNSCYKVDFIGDRSYAYLAESKIANYAEFRHQYEIDKKNNKNFINALTIAARKHQQLLVKKEIVIKSKGSLECKTSYQKQQLNHQIQLPQIEEKIQQIDSDNQYTKNRTQNHPLLQQTHQPPSIHIIEQEHPRKQEPQHDQHIEIPQKGSQEIQANELDQQIEMQNREKLIQQILTKYKLNVIPILKQGKKNQKQTSFNQKKRVHWKKKLIFKKRQSWSCEETREFGEQQLMSRKLYNFLAQKINSRQRSRQISLSLKEQIMRQKVQKRDCFKKVIDWIQMSDSQSILHYYSQWINFYKDNERQRQKHSNLTMQDESEELLIK